VAKKYELHIGLRLKYVISRVANSVICNPETNRNKARRAESGGGVLDGGSVPHPHQLGSLGERCKLPQPQWGPGQSPEKFGFWSILGPQKSRQNGQLAFESGGATSESGGQVPPLPQRRTTSAMPYHIDGYCSAFAN